MIPSNGLKVTLEELHLFWQKSIKLGEKINKNCAERKRGTSKATGLIALEIPSIGRLNFCRNCNHFVTVTFENYLTKPNIIESEFFNQSLFQLLRNVKLFAISPLSCFPLCLFLYFFLASLAEESPFSIRGGELLIEHVV